MQKIACCLSDAMKKVMSVFLMVLLLAVIVYVMFLARNADREFDYIGRTVEQDHQITIPGEAKIVAVPDVARFSLAVFTEGQDVAAAQKQTNEKMAAIIKEIKNLAIDDKDIKTSYYRVEPQYDWNESGRIFKGYRVAQGLDVTIRKMDQASLVLQKATDLGANDVGDLRFEIDDIESVKQTARLQALHNAKVKANEIAQALDVKIGRIIGFSDESTASPAYPAYAKEAMDMYLGAESAPAPAIEPGSDEVQSFVYVTFELL